MLLNVIVRLSPEDQIVVKEIVERMLRRFRDGAVEVLISDEEQLYQRFFLPELRRKGFPCRVRYVVRRSGHCPVVARTGWWPRLKKFIVNLFFRE